MFTQPQTLDDDQIFETLRMLIEIGFGDTDQSRHVRLFLLGLYNGNTWPFNFNRLRRIDRELQIACLELLKVDTFQPVQEIHKYIESGSEIFREISDFERVLAKTCSV